MPMTFRQTKSSYQIMVVSLAVSGVLLSACLSVFLWNKQARDWQQRFDLSSVRYQHVVSGTLIALSASLDDLGRFIESSDEVTDDEFAYYAQPMLSVFLGLSWIVPQVDVPKQNVSTGMALHDITPNCRSYGGALRYPIKRFISRIQGPLSGFDLRCDAARVNAMQTAERTRQITMTRRLSLLRAKQNGIVMFRPLFKRQQHAIPLGFVSAWVPLESVLTTALTQVGDVSQYQIRLLNRDLSSSSQLFGLGHMDESVPWMKTVDLTFASAHLQLQIQPTRQLWQQRHDAMPFLVFLVGCCFTALLVAWMNSQNKRRRQAELLAIARSDDLIDRETRLAALFAHAPIGIIRCDELGNMMEVNPTTTRLLGCTAGELAGRHFVSLLSEWSAREFRQRWSEPVWLELELVGAGGEEIPVLARVISLKLPNGKPYAWTMLEDLRSVRHNERLKREFIATVSHELRTPLTAVKGAVDLIRTGVLDDAPAEISRLLTMASHNAESLHQLIDDLLDMERLELGKLSLQLTRQALAPLIAHAQYLAAPLMSAKQLSWQVQNTEALLQVAVDGGRFVQVLANLISNAVKFSPVQGKLMLSVVCDEDTVRIHVQDEGGGIPPEFLPQLFQPFAQADGSDRRTMRGTGLGLAISHGLIVRMSGTLSARSHPGQGAEFIIELPRVCVQTGETHVAA